MNNRFYFPLVLAFILLAFGCRQDANLGLDFLPQNDILNIQIVDTSSINVYTVADDSLETTSPSQLLLGVYNDPVFGRYKAEFATQIALNSTSTFHPYYLDGTAESLIIYLPFDTIYSDAFYGDFQSQVQVNVYKLMVPISDTEKHYSQDTEEYFLPSDLVGTANLEFCTDTTLMIELSDELAQDFIDNSSSYFSVSDTLEFSEVFYGFYFSVVDDGSSDGVIARFNPSFDEAKVTLSYYPLSDNDSLYAYSFEMYSECASFSVFSHNYTGSALEFLENDSKLIQDSVAYLQSMGATKIKLEFPYLGGFSSIENFILNKAELVIKTEDTDLTNEDDFPAIEYMSLVAYDSNNDLILIDEFVNSSSSYTGSLYTDNEYRFDITRQIEDFIINDTISDEYSLYLVPLQRRYNFGRSVVTSGSHSNPMKLILTYTQY